MKWKARQDAVRTAGLVCQLLALGLVSLSPATARACPFCNSSTAQQVRAGIFNSDFTYNLVLTAAPFVVLFAVLFLILYWPPARAGGLTMRRASPLKRSNSTTDV